MGGVSGKIAQRVATVTWPELTVHQSTCCERDDCDCTGDLRVAAAIVTIAFQPQWQVTNAVKLVTETQSSQTSYRDTKHAKFKWIQKQTCNEAAAYAQRCALDMACKGLAPEGSTGSNAVLHFF
jgi:hypothetical protein